MPEENDQLANRNVIAPDAFEREVTTDLDEETPDKPKGLALHTRILIGLLVGVVAGVAVNYTFGGDHPRVVWIIDHITNPIGQLFLRLLLMIVVPLVFSSLVVGVAGIGDIRKLGRVGLKSFIYCFVLSAISVVIGLTLANTIRPGDRIDPTTKTALEATLRNRRYQTGGSGEEGRHSSHATDAGGRDDRALESARVDCGRAFQSQHGDFGRLAEHAAPHVLCA